MTRGSKTTGYLLAVLKSRRTKLQCNAEKQLLPEGPPFVFPCRRRRADHVATKTPDQQQLKSTP